MSFAPAGGDGLVAFEIASESYCAYGEQLRRVRYFVWQPPGCGAPREKSQSTQAQSECQARVNENCWRQSYLHEP
jgi:hypothetical protein